MKRTLAQLMWCACVGLIAMTATAQEPQTKETLNGAGASFPAPAYTRWMLDYNRATGIKLNYQSVGSSAGIQQIKANTVDFGASDDPLSDTELNANGMVQFPTLIGGVVPIINLPGIKTNELTLSGDILGKIYLGKIKRWNDRNIRRLNPGIKLPDLPIHVVYRADGSGTTAIFTDYLSKVSAEWKDGPGKGKSIRWPVGAGGQKNPGVANLVLQTEGGIGYVEYAYAEAQNIVTCKLKNAKGKIVAPEVKSFTAAASAIDWEKSKNFNVSINNIENEDAWPIVGASYIIIYRKNASEVKLRTLQHFWIWCLKNGREAAEELHYVTIPEKVIPIIEEHLHPTPSALQDVNPRN